MNCPFCTSANDRNHCRLGLAVTGCCCWRQSTHHPRCRHHWRPSTQLPLQQSKPCVWRMPPLLVLLFVFLSNLVVVGFMIKLIIPFLSSHTLSPLPSDNNDHLSFLAWQWSDVKEAQQSQPPIKPDVELQPTRSMGPWRTLSCLHPMLLFIPPVTVQWPWVFWTPVDPMNWYWTVDREMYFKMNKDFQFQYMDGWLKVLDPIDDSWCSC